ncbi:hypothetical protein AALP_AA1G196000 [Arabis alpina]|uniref:U3 small nucleolar RNA-associated protein 25 n=1 Tax=Arabis alpina TaxID=50452 RepID=A0A087HPA1_ARAAL|nr:hypothetical protein AALP_AA1G196000 [Arabis alpina]
MAPNSTGMLKRHRPLEKFDKKRDTKKYKRVEKAIASSPPPTEDLDSSEEDLSEDESEATVYRAPTPYEQLLASLGSSNKLVADMNKRRLREEEGRSDTEEDEDEEEEENSESDDISSIDGEDDDMEGDDQETLLGLTENTTQENNANLSEEEESDDCETDEDQELSIHGQSSSSSSAFSEHLNHTLSSEELINLPKGKWKFKWEAPAFGMPNCTWTATREHFLDGIQRDTTYGIKPKLFNHWRQLYGNPEGRDFESSQRRRFFSICNSYLDILHSNKKPFYHKLPKEDASAKDASAKDESTMDAYLMHSLNHIFKTRDLVNKNESKIAKHRGTAEEEILSDDGFRDQGFTRPKVLILLPMKSIAYDVVERLIQLTPESQKVNVEHRDQFNYKFGHEKGTVEGDEEKNVSNNKSSKPYDWQALFGEKNSDDDFMLGIKFTRKSIRLYLHSDSHSSKKNSSKMNSLKMNSSDMIIASPVRLHMEICEAEKKKENDKKEHDKEQDVDYLSSIEVLIIDHADIISMQNWSLLAKVVDSLNKLPSKQHGTNIMRIRQLYLDEHARFYRQSIILSSYLTTDISNLFNRQCLNYRGKMKLACKYKRVHGKVLLPVQQIYERFDADSMSQVDEARLEYFSKKIFPNIKDSVQGGVMILARSSFDYIRLRNFLKSQKASFCVIEENTKDENISRARNDFYLKNKKIMLYTERSYFYRRYQIRGIKKLIMYSPPERKEFYHQIVNMVEESHDMMCTVLFCRWDKLQLERIVGSGWIDRILTSEKNITTIA